MLYGIKQTKMLDYNIDEKNALLKNYNKNIKHKDNCC